MVPVRGPVKCGCGGVLLSHVLSGIVPSPCQGLASGFGMGPGVSPGPWPPQNSVILRSGGGFGNRIVDAGVEGCWCSCGTAVMMPPGSFRLVSWWCWLSSTVSAGRLHPSRGFHVRSINHMFSMGSHTPPRGVSGILILERASRLDAFSGYPSRTWPTSRAPGGTTGIPEVRPPRSSRTMGRPPQDSNERRV